MKKIILFSVFLFSFHISQAQCPMCKTSLESNQQLANEQSVGKGINKGIMYLLILPYLAVGTIIVVYRRKIKNTVVNG